MVLYTSCVSQPDENKTREQLIQELTALRKRYDEASHELSRIRSEAANENDRELSSLIDHMPIPIQQYTCEGIITLWNKASERLYGYATDEVVGKNLIDLIIPPDLHDAFKAALGQCKTLNSSGPFFPSGEVHLLNKDGHLVPVYSTHIAMIRQDCPPALYCLDINLTQQKAENTRLNPLMAVSSDGIAIINQEHKVVKANRRFAEMLGYTMEEVLKLHTWDYEATMTESHIRHNYADPTRTNLTFQSKYRRKDGTIFDVEVCAGGAMVFDEPLVLALSRDITDRKRSEELLRESEERFRTIYEQSPIAKEIYDSKGFLVDVNLACLSVFGVEDKQTILGFDLFNDPNITSGAKERLRKKEIVRYQAEFDFDKVRNLNLYPTSRSGKIFTDVIITPFGMDTVQGYLVQVQDITGRKRIEQALVYRERYLQSILHTTIDGFCVVDRNARFIEVNDALCRMSGYSRDELLNMNVNDLKLLGNPTSSTARINRIITNRSEIFEECYRHQSGKILEIEVSASFLDTNGGQIVTFLRDITERKLALKKLKKSREMLDRSEEIAHLGSWEYDTEQNRLIWSDEVYRIFGLEPFQFKGTREAFLEQVHPDDLVAVTEAYLNSLSKNDYIFEIEHRVIRKNTKEIRYVKEKCNHVFDSTGKVVRSFGIIHDISDQFALQRKLAESEEKYRTLFENMAQGAFFKDKNFKFIDVNPACLSMIGRDRDDFLSRPPYDPEAIMINDMSMKVLYDDHPGVIALREGRPVRNVTLGIYNPRKKKILWLNVTAIPQFKDGESVPYQVFVTMHDITEIREAEEKLKQAKKELEGKVAERTTALVEMNSALRVLLKQNDIQNKEHEDSIRLNMENLINPALAKLKRSGLKQHQTLLVENIEVNLNQVLSPICKRLLNLAHKLTPTEIKVADYVRQGCTNKQMASLIGVSSRTVAFHRENIRKKLGITNEKKNLQSILLNLS